MNQMVIDIQVANFLNAWRNWDNSMIGISNLSLTRLIPVDITDDEFTAALEIATKKYKKE